MNLSISEPTLWLFAFNTILVLTALLHMLYRRRSPQSLMAWLLTIILLPYIGVLIYFIFGLHKSLSDHKKPKISIHNISEKDPKIKIAIQIGQIMLANKIAGTTHDNQVIILDKDTTTYYRFMQAIQNAKTHIHIETYVFELDCTGKEILEALIKKARQGVEVRLLLDAFGSFSLYLKPKPLKQLTEAGGHYAFFHPFWSAITNSQINLRNHRKIYLFDQKTLLTGGMNLTNDYLGSDKNLSESQRWVDLMFEIKGPSTFHYQNIFNEDWLYSTQEKLSPPPKPIIFTQGDIIQSLPAGPDVNSEALFETLLHSIYHAKIHIQISTPYFIPDSSVMNALLIAIKRGVKITLITPKLSDHLIFDLGSSSYVRELLEAGGTVLYYDESILHAKLIIFDSLSAMIGSANLDYRSLFINYEMVNFIYSEHLIEHLSSWFEKQLNQSKIYQPSNKRSRLMFENMTRIMTPFL